MSIKLYTGRMGSGTTYEVVSVLILGTGFRAESAYKDLWLAKQVAREHVGSTPRVFVKIRRIKV